MCLDKTVYLISNFTHTNKLCVWRVVEHNSLFGLDKITYLFRYEIVCVISYGIQKYNYWFQTHRLLCECCDRHQLDQTSTLGGGSKFGRNFGQTSTPDMSKLRPNFDQTSTIPSTKLRPNCDHTSTKFRPNFDTPSVEVWSKFARYINEIHNKCDEMSTKLRHHTSTKLRPNFDQTSTKCRPNFDTTSFNIYYFIYQTISYVIQHISYLFQQPFNTIYYILKFIVYAFI